MKESQKFHKQSSLHSQSTKAANSAFTTPRLQDSDSKKSGKDKVKLKLNLDIQTSQGEQLKKNGSYISEEGGRQKIQSNYSSQGNFNDLDSQDVLINQSSMTPNQKKRFQQQNKKQMNMPQLLSYLMTDNLNDSAEQRDLKDKEQLKQKRSQYRKRPLYEIKQNKELQTKEENLLGSPRSLNKMKFNRFLSLEIRDNEIEYQKDYRYLKRVLAQEAALDDKYLEKEKQFNHQNPGSKQNQSHSKQGEKINEKVHVNRLKQVKSFVFENLKLPNGDYPQIEGIVKDRIIRENGIDNLKKKRDEINKQIIFSEIPEYRNFFKSHMVYNDLRNKLFQQYNFMEKFSIKEIKDMEKGVKQDKQYFPVGRSQSQDINKRKIAQKQQIQKQIQIEDDQGDQKLKFKIPEGYLQKRQDYSDGKSFKAIYAVPEQDITELKEFIVRPQTSRNEKSQNNSNQQSNYYHFKPDLDEDLNIPLNTRQSNHKLNEEVLDVRINQTRFDGKQNNFLDKDIMPESISKKDIRISLYENINWNKNIEGVFTKIREMTKQSLKKVGSRGLANQLACASLPYKDEGLKKVMDEIEKKIEEQQTPFYNLYANQYNVDVLQEELKKVTKQDIEDIEFEVANQILRQYNCIKNYIKKTRSNYFLKISKEIRHNYDIGKIKQEFVKILEKKREEHISMTKKIRLVLNLTEKQKSGITFQDKNFDKQKFFTEKLSKIDGFKGIREDYRRKEEEHENVDHNLFSTVKFTGVAHRKIIKKEEKIKKLQKCIDYYSGGPIQKRTYTRKDRNRAALIIQSAMRKYMGRLQLSKMKEEKEMLAYAKSKKQ